MHEILYKIHHNMVEIIWVLGCHSIKLSMLFCLLMKYCSEQYNTYNMFLTTFCTLFHNFIILDNITLQNLGNAIYNPKTVKL
jgi:hypothetical protein